tara:strand:+ start:218 stop:622 length:405 start_codon:yes stop_codon:yes gene_type:complete
MIIHIRREKHVVTVNLNVLGNSLEICSCEPLTGWLRDGFCSSSTIDIGKHNICCVMTGTFLRYSKAQGNDLSTPIPEYNFPGLKIGDKWCVCIDRWIQAFNDGFAPPVILASTSSNVLDHISLSTLLEHAWESS